MFGNLWIDPQKLLEFKVDGYKDGRKVLSRKVDQDLIELLTKRFNTKIQYSAESQETFAKLIDVSGLPVNNRSMKYSAGQRNVTTSEGGAIRYYKSPDELVERLQMLIGSKQGGKKSAAIDNEIVSILDRLHKDGAINKKDYKKYILKYNAFPDVIVLGLPLCLRVIIKLHRLLQPLHRAGYNENI